MVSAKGTPTDPKLKEKVTEGIDHLHSLLKLFITKNIELSRNLANNITKRSSNRPTKMEAVKGKWQHGKFVMRHLLPFKN